MNCLNALLHTNEFDCFCSLEICAEIGEVHQITIHDGKFDKIWQSNGENVFLSLESSVTLQPMTFDFDSWATHMAPQCH